MHREDGKTIYPLKTIVNPNTHRTVRCYDCPYTNLYETLYTTAHRLPDKIAVVDAERSVTWKELLNEVDRLSSALRFQYAVESGDRVGLLLMNSIYFCAAFYALAKIGAVAVVMNTKIAPPQLEWMLRDTQARLLISDDDWREKIRCMIENTQVQTVIYTHPCGEPAGEAYVTDMPALIESAPDQDSGVFNDVFAPALIMYTSGTTGVQKGALISHFGVLQNVYSYADRLQLDETECTVIGVPMFHITGLSCLMALFVFTGGKMVLVPKFNAKRVNELMLEHGATHVHAVPSVFTMLYDAQPEDTPILTLRSAVCGGGAIAPDTIRQYCAKNPAVAFHCAYGMTETAGAGVLFPSHYFDIEKDGAAGQVVPNAEIHVVDEHYHEVPAGVIGEICFAGSVVIDHYWNCGPDTGFHGGWLLTGDLGQVDEDGYVYIVDRKKDMINRSGEKIFSIMVEKEIYHLPEVDLCAVFPVHDPVHGEVGAAAVVLRPGAELDPERIRTYLLSRMAKYEVPQYIEIWDDIPLNPNNKISKYRLREEFEKKLDLKRGGSEQ